MRRDDKLGMLTHQVVHKREDTHLAGRRQSGFRFIKEINALSSKAMLKERKERFAMRLLVQAFASVSGQQRSAKRDLVQCIDFRGHRVNAFGPKEESVDWPNRRAFQLEAAVQVGM